MLGLNPSSVSFWLCDLEEDMFLSEPQFLSSLRKSVLVTVCLLPRPNLVHLTPQGIYCPSVTSHFQQNPSHTFSLLLFSCQVMFNSLRPHRLQRTRLLCPSPSPGVRPSSSPLNQWCCPTISSPVIPFSSCPRSFPASGSFPISQLSARGGQSIVTSALASVLPMNIQGWLPLGLTGLISLQSKGLSRAFSSTTVQKHQFFGTQPSLWSNSHICTWLLEKP